MVSDTTAGGAGAGLAREIALGLVALASGPDGAGGAEPTSLAWPLGLSVAMRRHGARPADVVATLAALRAAVLETSGLDRATEPVPLPVADLTMQAVTAALYLVGLIGRASAVTGEPPVAVIEGAVALLSTDVALTA